MYKKIFAIMIFFVFFLGAPVCFAAEADPVWVVSQKGNFTTVTVTLTADDADGSVTTRQIPYSNQIMGRLLFSVNTYYGATGPTDNTDLQILDAAAGDDVLNGAGTNMIDNAANRVFMPIVRDQNHVPVDTMMPITTPLWIKVTGNSVNSAIMKIVIKFI